MHNTNNNLYIQQIQHILQGVHIDRTAGKLFLNWGEKEYDFIHSPQTNETNLLNILTQCIYSQFYCTGYNSSLQSIAQAPIDAKERALFIDALSRANATEEGFDWGWKIEQVDDKNNIYATKGNIKKLISSGEYINEKMGQVISSTTYGREAQYIRYYRRKEMRGEEGAFYYVFNQHIGEDNAQSCIRIYFNIESEGAPSLVNLVTHTFNRYKVPFQFKCLNQPSSFSSRTDTAVLYLYKPHFNFAIELLARSFDAIAPFLKPDIPLFTRPLSKIGIAFAESPPNPDDSFGLNRSRLIALGWVNAINKQQPVQIWLNEILQKIEQAGLNISTFYLNPKSTYPYTFV